jgi:hypothetical protein
MKVLQSEMRGASEEAGLTSEEDVMALVRDLRQEEDEE